MVWSVQSSPWNARCHERVVGSAVWGIIEARHQVFYMLHPRETSMRTMITLLAAASMLSIGIGSAYAGDGDRQSALTTLLAQQNADSVVGARERGRPLFTIGGMEVRVWAPVAPPYNDGTYGDVRPRPPDAAPW
jgi:hypothetical protein